MRPATVVPLLILVVAAGCDTSRPTERQLPTEPATVLEASASRGAAADGKRKMEATLCHNPRTSTEQTLTVPEPAVLPHLRHGDKLEACGPPAPPGAVLLLPETIGGGRAYSCGLTSAGKAYCWGANYEGELGIGTGGSRGTPTPVFGNYTFTQLSVGTYHACGLTASGAAYCWGYSRYGEVGDGSQGGSIFYPVPVAGGLAFQQITTGNYHTCALTVAGAAYCWGSDYNATPTAVQTDLVFAQINAGSFHTCALTSGGAAYCWGTNNHGQLGDGTTTDRSAPTAVMGLIPFRQINGGGLHSCGVSTGGTAYCWGYNGEHQLGDGTTTINRLFPWAIFGGRLYARISAGDQHTCGLLVSGEAYCWGDNGFGQLGDGTTTSHTTPTAVAAGLGFSQVNPSTGAHTCGVTTTGEAYCWGDNQAFQLGDGTTTARSTPGILTGLAIQP